MVVPLAPLIASTFYGKAHVPRATFAASHITLTKYNKIIMLSASRTCKTQQSRRTCTATYSLTASGNQKAPPAAARGNLLFSEAIRNDHLINHNLPHSGKESNGKTCSSAELVPNDHLANQPTLRRRQLTHRGLRNYMIYITE